MRLKTSRRRGSSALAVLGAGLGIYVVAAAGYHSLVEPALAKRSVLPVVALQQAPPAAPTVQIPVDPASYGQMGLPAHFAAKPKPIAAPPTPPRAAATATAAVTTDGNAAAEPRKPARRQVARDPRRERPWGGGSWGGGWGSWGGRSFASGPSNGSRPWF